MIYSIIITSRGGWVFAPESATVPRSHSDRGAIDLAVFRAFRVGEYEILVTVEPEERVRWRTALKSRSVGVR